MLTSSSQGRRIMTDYERYKLYKDYHRYQVVTYSDDCGSDDKMEYITLAEAKAQCKYYIKFEEEDAAAIYDHKIGKVVALYNGFNQYTAFNERAWNENAKIYWID